MNATSYLQGDGLYYRFDPRMKTLTTLLAVATFFFPVSNNVYGVYLSALLGLGMIDLGLRETLRPLRTIIPFLVLIIICTPPFYRAGETVYQVGDLVVLTADGVQRTVQLMLRFTGISLALILYARTTHLHEVILSFRAFGLPHRAALLLSMSFAMVPTLMGVYRQTVEAHLLRKGDSRDHRFTRRFVSLVQVLTSVMIHAVRTIPVTSMSLEHRGLRPTGYRSSYKVLKGGRRLFTHGMIFCIIALILTFPLYL